MNSYFLQLTTHDTVWWSEILDVHQVSSRSHFSNCTRSLLEANQDIWGTWLVIESDIEGGGEFKLIPELIRISRCFSKKA